MSAVGVQGVTLLAEYEIPLRIRHVIPEHGRQRLDERHPALGRELVLDAAVDDHDVALPSVFVSLPIVIVTSPSTIHITCSAVGCEWRRTVVPGS